MKTSLKIKFLLVVLALVGASLLAAPEAQAHLYSSGDSVITPVAYAPSPFANHAMKKGHVCPLNPQPGRPCPHHWIGPSSKTLKAQVRLSPFCHGKRLPSGVNFQFVKQAPMSLDGAAPWTPPDSPFFQTRRRNKELITSAIDKPPPRSSVLYL